ncbi:hypothetical protein CJ030_MR3G001136 [Morella rubra]|uniref:Uncharacterized protein n=1 Tax=Morella rubra TaxID=262757 RepID=A0A6A1W2F5_9ROSI|nr:hypothetical protein CJ030_MR3G001136 [Morella rubra]
MEWRFFGVWMQPSGFHEDFLDIFEPWKAFLWLPPVLSWLAGMDSFTSTCTQFTSMLCDLGYDNTHEVNGLDAFYGMDMVNASTAGTTSSGESVSLGQYKSPLVYLPLVSDYEGCQQD